MSGHIVLFQHVHERGAHVHVFASGPQDGENNLHDMGFGDTMSSFVVISGQWKFYQHVGYQGEYTPTFGPGVYPSASDAGIPNDQVSSVRCVAL